MTAPEYPVPPQPAHPAPGTPIAVDPRELPNHAMRADEVTALEPKEIG